MLLKWVTPPSPTQPFHMRSFGVQSVTVTRDYTLPQNYDHTHRLCAKQNVTANYFKCTQNKKIRDILLTTGNKILIEASPMDKKWGIVFSKKDAEATNPKLWLGTNVFGFALMEVRNELKLVYQNYDKIDWVHFQNR